MDSKLDYTQKHFVDTVMELDDADIRKTMQALVDTLIEHKLKKDQAPKWSKTLPDRDGYWWMWREDESEVGLDSITLPPDMVCISLPVIWFLPEAGCTDLSGYEHENYRYGWAFCFQLIKVVLC